jgi:hypothetical protein
MRTYEFRPGELLDRSTGTAFPGGTIIDLDAIVRATWKERGRHLLALADGSDLRLSSAGFKRVVTAWTGQSPETHDGRHPKRE